MGFKSLAWGLGRRLIGDRVAVYVQAIRGISAYGFQHFPYLGGLAAIAYGCSLIYRPLGFIVGGWLAVKVALTK